MNQDPIGVEGGFNFYRFAPNAQELVDVWGLKNNSPLLQRLEKQGLFKLNGKGNGIMLPESLSKGTTCSKHKGYHRGYNQAIMEIVDNIDKNSKCDREKARKIQLLQSKIHKALKSGSISLYKPTTKQDWINYLT